MTNQFSIAPATPHTPAARCGLRSTRPLKRILRVLGIAIIWAGTLASTVSAQAPRLGSREQAQYEEAQRLYKQARRLQNDNRPLAALPAAQRTVQLCAAALGEVHEDTAASRNLLAAILGDLDRFEESKQEYERALATYKQLYGPRHVEVLIPLQNLARTLLTMQASDEAAKCYEEIFAILPHIQDPGALHELRALRGAATLARMRRDYETAEKHLRRGIALCDTTPGVNPEIKPELYDELGEAYLDRLDYETALGHYRQAIQLYRQRFGERNPGLAHSYERLAVALRYSGRYADARSAAERAIKLNETIHGPRNFVTLLSYMEYAKLLYTLGNYRDAASQFERAVAGFETELGGEHTTTAAALTMLGAALYEIEEFQRSRELLNRALEIQKRIYGENNQGTVNALFGLAVLAEREDALEQSLEYHRQVLAMHQAIYGESHPNVASSLLSLGYLLESLGREAEAQSRLSEALAMRQKLLGDRHMDTAFAKSSLAVLKAAAGDLDGAVALTDQARRAMQQHTATILPSMSEYEQLQFLNTVDRPGRDYALSIGLAQRSVAALVAQSAEWLLNSKAVANEALTQRARLLRDARNSQSAELVQELLRVRQRLAAAAYQDAGERESDSRQAELKRLAAAEQELSRQLDLDRGQAASHWIKLDDVRKAIPPEAVLVDLARFEPTDFQAPGKTRYDRPARYVAWIIPSASRGEVRLVDLGEAAAIDAQLEKARKAIEAPQVIHAEGEVDAEALAVEALEKLAALIFRPLLEALPYDPQMLLLSPDANLWLAPWSALPLADGRYAIEQYEFSFLVSARDLAAMPTKQLSVGRPVIMANPDFDLAPRDALVATQAVLRTQLPPLDQLAMRSTGSGSRLARVQRLPGTAAEAEAIRPRLAALADNDPLVYTDKYALEGVFKAVSRPKVLVLSTHGFFLQDQQAGGDQRPGSTPGAALENPLLRCGLLLAGCNERQLANGSDDGVLTGLEVVGADLRGTELVVLSACQTGLGQINNGEGVAGLRQAFLLAGAQAVVATLWQIPDRETALLMNDFFANLAAGQSNSAALRQAQLAQIEARRALNGAAHPYFWAAFTLTGR